MITLYVDRQRWEGHLQHHLATHPGLVPVAKGNGYGFGIEALAAKANELGVDTIAVGTYDEVVKADGFHGDVLVLTPWRPFELRATYDERVVHTVGRIEDLRDLAVKAERPRVVLERMTSMRRHGFSARGLREAGEAIGGDDGGVRVDGVAFHLPMGHGSHLTEVDRMMTDVIAAELPTKRVYVSHLTDNELAMVRATWRDYEIRPRIGTNLWLGDRAALSVKATVLDVHEVERGDVFGYRGRSAPKHGYVVIVSGGTSHGIGLEAPNSNTSLKDRAATVARGGLDAAGFVRSPFTIDGKQRLFAEPPHMQASMLFVPAGAHVPEVGDEIDVRVRFTATSFDRTILR
ncbi:MAG TPA: alanine racemase [Nocardioidaceae bacterium]|nr:alanine racemase [Nocardioidaceae bacterium]